MGAIRRHPADVTADRLGDALDKWPDAFDGGDRDMIGQLIHILRTIAEGGSSAANEVRLATVQEPGSQRSSASQGSAAIPGQPASDRQL